MLAPQRNQSFPCSPKAIEMDPSSQCNPHCCYMSYLTSMVHNCSQRRQIWFDIDFHLPFEIFSFSCLYRLWRAQHSQTFLDLIYLVSVFVKNYFETYDTHQLKIASSQFSCRKSHLMILNYPLQINDSKSLLQAKRDYCLNYYFCAQALAGPLLNRIDFC